MKMEITVSYSAEVARSNQLGDVTVGAMSVSVLHILTSAMALSSTSRLLGENIVSKIEGAKVVIRDVGVSPVPAIDQDWVNAAFTPVDQRSEAQKSKLAISDTLIQELFDADVIVLSIAVYNFNIPASFKAWIDQVVRAGITFQRGPGGSKGLLKGKKVYIATASGGTPVDSANDYYSKYLKYILGFIGLHDVTFVCEATTGHNKQESISKALAAVDKFHLDLRKAEL